MTVILSKTKLWGFGLIISVVNIEILIGKFYLEIIFKKL